jgi:ABC-type Fe3+/spermidine/putrescine transport system ATPase subunit
VKTTPPLLCLENVVCRRGGFRLAVNDFQLASGEIRTIVGPSGSGKTTLLLVCAGLLRPETGTVKFEGCPIDQQTGGRRALRTVFQDGGLFPHLTSIRQVAMSIRDQDVSRAEREKLAAEWLLRLRIEDAEMSRPSDTLSGGQKQRVALARALAGSPKLLLMDEPLTGLDPAFKSQFWEDVLAARSYADSGTAFLIVTHDPLMAVSYSDTIALVEDEVRVLAAGDLFRNPLSRWVNSVRDSMLSTARALQRLDLHSHDSLAKAG